MDGGWRTDPTGRHPMRWHDGDRFTDYVADGDHVTVDPLPPAPPVVPPAAGSLTTSAAPTPFFGCAPHGGKRARGLLGSPVTSVWAGVIVVLALGGLALGINRSGQELTTSSDQRACELRTEARQRLGQPLPECASALAQAGVAAVSVSPQAAQTLQSAVRNAALSVEAESVRLGGHYPGSFDGQRIADAAASGAEVTLTYVRSSGQFCLAGTHSRLPDQVQTYRSNAGGMQPLQRGAGC